MNTLARVALVLTGWVVFLGLSVGGARADWINLSGAETAFNIAEVYVLDDRVRLVLEVYIGDLEIFADLVPDDLLRSTEGRPALQERMQAFAENTLQMVTETGEKLPARLERAEPRSRVDRKSAFAGMINPYTRQRVPAAPDDRRVLYAEISYPFEQKPQTLTIVPPLDDQGRARVNIGFIAYHKSVPIIDFRYLSAPARLSLDWSDPWYSRFDNPNLKRHHKDALMSYLYIEPYEVRHEILVRAKDMAVWMDLGLRGDTYIEVDELEPLKQRVGEFLMARNPVRIDGKAVNPILDRSNFVKLALTGIQLLERPERLELNGAIIGVIITYLTKGLPHEVTVDWELFTDQIERVPATATDPAGPLMTYLTRDSNVHTWTNYLKNYTLPTVREVAVKDSLSELKIPLGVILAAALLLMIGWLMLRKQRQGKSIKWLALGALVVLVAGTASYPYTRVPIARPELAAGDMDREHAAALLQTLLKNVYRAFDFHSEEDVYDKLALTVQGDLLADLYLQNRRSFAIKQAGGAQAKIQSVDVQHAEATRLEDRDSLSYAITGQWTAAGSVGHWGHIHTRVNRYDAVVTVESVDGQWKITELEVLEEQRIDPKTTSPVQPARDQAATTG